MYRSSSLPFFYSPKLLLFRSVALLCCCSSILLARRNLASSSFSNFSIDRLTSADLDRRKFAHTTSWHNASRDTSAITNGQKRRYVEANRWETHTVCFNGSFKDVDNRLTSRDTSAITNGKKRRYVGANRWETHTVCFNGSFKDLHIRLTSRDTSTVKKRQKTSVCAG